MIELNFVLSIKYDKNKGEMWLIGYIYIYIYIYMYILYSHYHGGTNSIKLISYVDNV